MTDRAECQRINFQNEYMEVVNNLMPGMSARTLMDLDDDNIRVLIERMYAMMVYQDPGEHWELVAKNLMEASAP